MVQMQENMTRLEGRVLSREPHPARPGYERVTLQLERAEAVPGKADFLSRHLGAALQVAVPAALMRPAADVAGGGRPLRLVCRALMTPDGALAENDPAAGDFRLEPL